MPTNKALHRRSASCSYLLAPQAWAASNIREVAQVCGVIREFGVPYDLQLKALVSALLAAIGLMNGKDLRLRPPRAGNDVGATRARVKPNDRIVWIQRQ